MKILSKEQAQKWINTSKPGTCIVYYTGHLVEDRQWALVDKIKINQLANIFMEAADKKNKSGSFKRTLPKIDLFQRKIKKGDLGHKPIFEYIARKINYEKNQDQN